MRSEPELRDLIDKLVGAGLMARPRTGGPHTPTVARITKDGVYATALLLGAFSMSDIDLADQVVATACAHIVADYEDDWMTEAQIIIAETSENN